MNLSAVIAGVAHKTLVAVDLPGTASNQHEVNGDAGLKSLFGTATTKKCEVRWIYFSDSHEPEAASSSVTFYDARAKKSHLTGRSEWRLYYEGGFLKRAKPGDHIVFILGARGDFFALIFQPGSNSFKAACLLFGLPESRDTFSVVSEAILSKIDLQSAKVEISNQFGEVYWNQFSRIFDLERPEINIRSDTFAFKPRARMLVLLGDQLIRDAGIAVFELVKNSYDADATNVRVLLDHVSQPHYGKIIVEDDGCGMDWEQVVNVWLEPGTDYRQQQKLAGYRTPRFNRLPLGEKGVGRFAAHKLGKRIILISRKLGSPEVVVTIDWNAVSSTRYLSDTSVQVSEREPVHFIRENTGTRIEISDLNEEIGRGTIRQIYRAITSVCSPFRSPNEFSATLRLIPDDNSLSGLATIEKVLELAPYRATCLIDKGTLTYDYDFVPVRGMDKVAGRSIRDRKLDVPDLDLFSGETAAKIGPLLLEFRIYDLDTQTLEYAVSDRRGFKDFLKQNGGIRVYRDGVRVYDYGEYGNDWLELGEGRVNQPAARISNNQVIAAVHLDGSQSRGLIEKTNREGFIEDSAYLLFRSMVRFTLTQIVFERNHDKDRVRALYSQRSLKEPVISELTELRSILDKLLQPSVANEIKPLVDRVENQYVEMRERLLTAAGAGLTLSTVIHEVEKAIKYLSVAVERNSPISELRNLANHLDELIEGLTYLTRKSGRQKELMGELVRQVLLNTNYRIRAHKINVINGIQQNGNPNINVTCTRRLIIATLMNLIDNSIYWLSTKGSTERTILIGTSTELNGGPVLFVADNGPGFQDDPEILTQPFMSRKPEGMGLGLHIASEVMKAHDGKLVFPKREELGLEATWTGAIVGLQFNNEL